MSLLAGGDSGLHISWTRLPFAARTREEFSRGLADWLGQVFYETLPAQGYEVREEQIYTAFRMARALADGQTLFAEAGAGTGKTFAYLLPAIAYARFRGKPVVVASATGVLQAQLADPKGDIATLSRLLGLQVDARVAADAGQYLCKVKGNRFYPGRAAKGWKALQNWTRRTATGARSEVRHVPDELWEEVAWDSTLPCDTCKHRGTCHVMAARSYSRAAGDLVVTDHRLFAQDLLTRAERTATGQLPLLPAYAAAVMDEGHHLPEVWQRSQGYELNARRLTVTLDLLEGFAKQPSGALAEAREAGRQRLARVLIGTARQAGEQFLHLAFASAEPGEGKRHLERDGALLEAAAALTGALEALGDDLVTEEAMQEGTDSEVWLRAHQTRLDGVIAALTLVRSPDSVAWVEGESLWVVPRHPAPMVDAGREAPGAAGHLAPTTPVLFSSATLEPAYMASVLRLPRYASAAVGVPFRLAEQVLVYQPAPQSPADDELAQTLAVIHALQGRTLVLVNSMAEVQRCRQALAGLPWTVLAEGDADRGAMLEAFRADTASVLVGTTLWEGMDVPGDPLSCVVIPRLPFPAHDPLIRERRLQAEGRGEDPFLAVDLPEMIIRLKQGAGRLIRTASDRGVLALLDRSYLQQPWAEAVDAVLPEGAERTADLERVAGFCPRTAQ
jgi:ATP-dependent DNA helicase DinG